jgi:hypothetical protein
MLDEQADVKTFCIPLVIQIQPSATKPIFFALIGTNASLQKEKE